MKKTLCLCACSGITCLILSVIEQQASLNLSFWPYIGIGAVFALIDIATDRND